MFSLGFLLITYEMCVLPVWARAIGLTSPLIVNLGTSTSIPLSFLADYLNPVGMLLFQGRALGPA